MIYCNTFQQPYFQRFVFKIASLNLSNIAINTHSSITISALTPLRTGGVTGHQHRHSSTWVMVMPCLMVPSHRLNIYYVRPLRPTLSVFFLSFEQPRTIKKMKTFIKYFALGLKTRVVQRTRPTINVYSYAYCVYTFIYMYAKYVNLDMFDQWF